MALVGELIDELRRAVGADHVLTDDDSTAAYGVDWTGRFRGTTPAVVRPATTAEVAEVVSICRRHRAALVPQGGNTGLVGGGVPTGGEIVLSLRRIDTIGPVDVAARQVTVGAGAIVADVRAAARDAGLQYAVDFGARDSATIGGTIATNAGGINVLRYGGTRQQLIGVEAVLGNGDVVSRLGGLVKDNTGYHLPSLLCGSEGTLGVVTAARLALVTSHAHHVTALVGFTGVAEAVAAVGQWRSALDSIEAAEIFLDEGLTLVCDAFGLPLPLQRRSPAYVLVECADHDDPTDALAAAVAGAAGVDDVAVATDEVRRAALWRYREEHTLALASLGAPHKLDVTLPIGRLTEFMAEVPHRVAAVAPTERTWMFGHVGDGNLHVNITGATPTSLAYDDLSADEAVLRYVCELGGSISAEHGIGTAKSRWLHLNRTPAEIDAMRAIKRALDPDGILNPRALLPRRA